MGGGLSAWKEFLSDAVEPELKRLDVDENLIPPDRSVVLSIDEYDELISVLMNKPIDLSSILWQMLKDNANPQTNKFVFSMHLEPHQTGDFKVPYLDDELNQLFDEAGSYLRTD